MAQLTRYEPWDLLHDMSTLFEHAWGRTGNGTPTLAEKGALYPAVDIKEKNDHFELIADVPGLDPKQIEISVENRTLTISGERTRETKEEKENYYRSERVTGKFYRSFTLPQSIDSDGITAKSRNGVLEVILPKEKESAVKKIQVKTD